MYLPPAGVFGNNGFQLGDIIEPAMQLFGAVDLAGLKVFEIRLKGFPVSNLKICGKEFPLFSHRCSQCIGHTSKR
jgi:hypothetical protein